MSCVSLWFLLTREMIERVKHRLEGTYKILPRWASESINLLTCVRQSAVSTVSLRWEHFRNHGKLASSAHDAWKWNNIQRIGRISITFINFLRRNQKWSQSQTRKMCLLLSWRVPRNRNRIRRWMFKKFPCWQIHNFKHYIILCETVQLCSIRLLGASYINKLNFWRSLKFYIQSSHEHIFYCITLPLPLL